MIIINPLPHGVTRALLISFFAWSAAHPAVFTVTNTADSGAGSLRQAIINVNASVDATNTINFNIPGTGPFTIAPATDLPNISVNVTINGYSQPGSSVNTLAQGDNAVLQIIINGSDYTVGDGQFSGNGLHFVVGSDGSIVKGLVINQWLLNGILIDATAGAISNIQILGNFLGTDNLGASVLPNRTSIGMSSSTDFVAIAALDFFPINNTVIGTPAPADRNVICGSFGQMLYDGYYIPAACIGTMGGVGTSIKNNYIGVDVTGTIALGSSGTGIFLSYENTLNAGASSFIGGSTTSERNIVSGHNTHGIYLTGGLVYGGYNLSGCSNCIVQNNYIGTDITGTVALGNGNAGIRMNTYAKNNTIVNNLISGNNIGIALGDIGMPGTMLNTIQGNKIGTDVTGLTALANTGFGMVIGSNQNTIGGSVPAQGNLISGNLKGGILMYSADTNTIIGNYIGTNISGTTAIPNGGPGIQVGTNGPVSCAGTNNTIGS